MIKAIIDVYKRQGVTHVTNLAGAQAMVAGMEVARGSGLTVVALQDLPQWEPTTAEA